MADINIPFEIINPADIDPAIGSNNAIVFDPITGAEGTKVIVQDKLDATTSPAVTDDSDSGYAVGSKWVDIVAEETYECSKVTVGAAVWKISTASGGTDEKASVSANDTTPGYLNGKLVQGSGITLTENNDGGDETLTIAATGGGGALGISFVLRGDAYVGTKQTQILMPANATIDKVITYVDTAPTGASLIVDINKNGTTIFTTQSGRPEIAISGNTADSATPDVTALSQDDRISIDVDQVGSTIVGGSDLLVTIVFA